MINKNNLKFVKDKFRELNIQLSKQELEFATKMFERKARALAISRRLHEKDENGDYFKYYRMLDKDTGEVDEYVWDLYFNKRNLFNNSETMNYGNDIKEFLLKSQNHLMINQEEEKFSVSRSNEVSRQIRDLNNLILTNTNLQRDNYFNKQFIQALVKKIFKIQLDNFDLTTAVRDRNFLKYFFNSESLITSDKLFWIVFDVVYSYSNFNEFNISDWERVLSRYNRLSNDEYYTERCKKVFGDIVAKHSKQFFNNTNLNEYITMYRGFLVKPTRSVRKDRKKLNNPNAHIQDEGRGFSYTLDKEQANRFASRYHFRTDFEFRKNLPTLCGSMSHNKILKNLRRDYKRVLGDNYNQNYLDLDTRRCVGTFRVKKKHIITFNVLNSETEILADPNNVELVRYDFVNDKQDAESAYWGVNKRHATRDKGSECFLELHRKQEVCSGLEKSFKDFPIQLIKEFKDPTLRASDYQNLSQQLTDKFRKEESNG